MIVFIKAAVAGIGNDKVIPVKHRCRHGTAHRTFPEFGKIAVKDPVIGISQCVEQEFFIPIGRIGRHGGFENFPAADETGDLPLGVAADAVGDQCENCHAAGRSADEKIILIMTPVQTDIALSGNGELSVIILHIFLKNV